MSKKKRKRGSKKPYRRPDAFQTGEKVEFCEQGLHDLFPHLYPPVGTIGTVVKYDPPQHYQIRWPQGAISYTGEWYYDHKHLKRHRREVNG